MNISRRLKRIRLSNNLSRKEMAEKTYISYSHYSNIQSGRFPPTETILKAFANHFMISEAYLLNYDTTDNHLEELLDSLKAAIDHFQFTEAQEKISIISEDYPEINSINQEAYFLLLTYYMNIAIY